MKLLKKTRLYIVLITIFLCLFGICMTVNAEENYSDYTNWYISELDMTIDIPSQYVAVDRSLAKSVDEEIYNSYVEDDYYLEVYNEDFSECIITLLYDSSEFNHYGGEWDMSGYKNGTDISGDIKDSLYRSLGGTETYRFTSTTDDGRYMVITLLNVNGKGLVLYYSVNNLPSSGEYTMIDKVAESLCKNDSTYVGEMVEEETVNTENSSEDNNDKSTVAESKEMDEEKNYGQKDDSADKNSSKENDSKKNDESKSSGIATATPSADVQKSEEKSNIPLIIVIVLVIIIVAIVAFILINKNKGKKSDTNSGASLDSVIPGAGQAVPQMISPMVQANTVTSTAINSSPVDAEKTVFDNNISGSPIPVAGVNNYRPTNEFVFEEVTATSENTVQDDFEKTVFEPRQTSAVNIPTPVEPSIPFVEPIPTPAESSILEPTVAPSAEPVVESIPTPVESSILEPTVAPSAEPVVESIPTPVESSILEPTVAPVAEIVAEPTSVPVEQPIIEAVEPEFETTESVDIMVDKASPVNEIDFNAEKTIVRTVERIEEPTIIAPTRIVNRTVEPESAKADIAPVEPVIEVAKVDTTAEETSKPKTEFDNISEIKKWKSLLDDGIISEEEFAAKKKEILGL